MGLTNPRNPVSGAINAIAAVPGDPNTLYAGAVNGGVWKTTNATAVAPTWTPVTDPHLKALSIRSLAISPLNSADIFAGTGSSSSYSSRGNPGFGVARSEDGGLNWRIEAASTFEGAAIVSIVPTSAKGVVLAATGTQDAFDKRGLFRSTDNGKIFTQVSSDGVSGLPDNNVSDIAADPTTPNRYYLAIPDTYTSSGFTGAGVWKSEDYGATWTKVSAGLVISSSTVIRLSVSKADGAVYAMVMNGSGLLSGVFFSKTRGASWTKMGTPAATIFPGSQAGDQGAIIAHPTLAGIVFIGGDYHPFTNGCTDFGGNILRGDTSKATASQWTDIVCNGANGTAPHADTRAFAFNSSGTILLHGCDGGLFRLNSPDSAARKWASFNGNIRPSEIHNIAYDSLSHVLLSGNQDTGSSYQLSPNNLTWTDISLGDGSNVAVDADQTAHPGTSIRYESYTELQSFTRHTFGSNNVEISRTEPALNIVSGPGTGSTILDYDSTRQFNNPFILNRYNPQRILIGTSSLYESFDQGESLDNLGSLGAPVSAMSYGSALNGVTYAGAFYVGAGATIYHRTSSAEIPTMLPNYPGSAVLSLVMDPLDYKHVYVLDSNGRVYGSFDEGVTWRDFTGDLASKVSQPQTIEIFSPPVAKGNKNDQDLRVIVGGIGHVVHLRTKLGETLWTRSAEGLPKGVYIYDLHYDVACDVLVAGSLGRGAWTLNHPFSVSAGGTCPPVVASGNTGASATSASTGAQQLLLQNATESAPAASRPPVANRSALSVAKPQ